MFVITTTKEKTITWPVKVEVAADGGKIAKHEFTGTFKLLDDDDREAIVASNADLDTDESPTVKDDNIDKILKVMTDWSGVVDEQRTPIPFNRDTLRTAVRSAHGLAILRGINTAIYEIGTGARAKN